MLSCVVFCCLVLVQVQAQCHIRELRNKIITFNNTEACMGRESAKLRLSTKWTDCKWLCLNKGFDDIQKQLTSVRTCASKITSINHRIVAINKRACEFTHCNETCEAASSGNMRKFLAEAVAYLQAMEYNSGINKS